ncbi:hypothetical protein Tco_1123345 [Tanacetum coccineum]|uniref:Uncharacterized protein n=1 Tax=Tanacetum coccineum TaxID=301880 RepID=A0ABQ5J333_9ASTR
MKISSFMDAHKYPELVKRHYDKVPKTVDEMMTRLDDFVRSEEAFARTELPKGEASKAFKKSTGPISKGKIGSTRQGIDSIGREMRKGKRSTARMALLRTVHKLHIRLLGLTIRDTIIPWPMQLPPKTENQDRYFDYHGEKGPYTNDCFQLRRQFEMALELGKLNHLIKGVRQRGRGNTKGRDAPIVFPPLSMEDASDEPLIIEAVMKGSVVKPLGKIELEVVFSDGGLFRRVMINFTVVQFPTPRWIATLVTRTMIISECRRLEKKQMIEAETNRGILPEEEPQERLEETCPKDDPCGDQGSQGVGKGRNSSTGEIPYMDIKPVSSEEKRWKLEDVHRLQKS